MKNLSQFKKRIKVGDKVLTTFHKTFIGRDPETGNVIYADSSLGVRPVSIVQSNSFAFKTEKKDGTFSDSWCDFPKASKCSFPDENTICIDDYDGKPVLTYKFI